MNQLRFTCMLIYAAMVVSLASCGGGSAEKTSTDSTSASTDTTTVSAAPRNKYCYYHTAKYDGGQTQSGQLRKMESSYDEHDSTRLAYGIHSYVIGRSVQDSNMVMVAVKVDDMAKAKAFAKDPSLKEAMKKGGVTGMPSFSFVTITFQDTAVINSDLRSRTTFTVKDWDAWQKAFEEGKQERLDNGLTVRAYGHDVDNNNKVVLVTAITDTTKAYAYWKSDMLKKRRAASGVIGEPERFVYRVVQRY